MNRNGKHDTGWLESYLKQFESKTRISFKPRNDMEHATPTIVLNNLAKSISFLTAIFIVMGFTFGPFVVNCKVEFVQNLMASNF